ncbi:hypothetical protein HYX04_00625 [Candidatus Woesearchaeota archaeon]|nr:hypothetical protein [Candidatus Woesearchaeota archaeon]
MEAQVWIKRGGIMGKDTSKPIRFKTIQKNTKLAEFVADEAKPIYQEEQQLVD